jgi:ABC-type nitrate/sulfonate/bicarbonate transport system substrate-binding protein
MNKIKIALDWTPNINHIGFFIAKDKGFYKKYNLDVDIIDTSVDNYAITPAKKVELGQVDFALCPMESIISYRTKSKPFSLIAIAAILQEDLSAIAVKSDSNIKSPKDLDHKVYSSYKARYEDGIVRQMIINDGGLGDLNIIYPDKLGIWDNLIKGKSDATWIFLNWEGVEAQEKGLDLAFFKLNEFEIPYSYSPVLAASEEKIDFKHSVYKDFLQATKEGYLFAQEQKEEAINILKPHIPKHDSHINLLKALELTAPYFGNKFIWGKLVPKRVTEFLEWLEDKNLEKHKMKFTDVATIL